MAFFKFRKGVEDSKITPAPEPSIEAIRKRAKQRLVGAVVLVLMGVIGFPLLVDNQPRPIAVDIPIDIPDRNKVKPLEPAQASASSPAQASGPILQAPLPTPRVDKPHGLASETKPPAQSITQPITQPAPAAALVKPAEMPANKDAAKSAEKTPDKAPPPDLGAKAQALLDASPLPKATPAISNPASAASASATPASAAASQERYIVQFGAYADANKARESRLKVEATGLKTYAQMVETKEGKRYRVRVGPFATKAEADKAAEQIKKLDLPVAILTL
jgi:DedD protein